MLRTRHRWGRGAGVGFVVMVLALLVLDSATSVPSSASSVQAAAAKKSPIIIGAVIDESNFMKSFDVPALDAAKIEANKINSSGGVDGRKIEFKVYNDQLQPSLTRSDALQAVSAGASVLWVTCDVDLATPAIEVGLQHGLLTVSPCIGTNDMGPSRFGSEGKLAFSFGNSPTSDGAVLARLLMQKKWKTATVVTDNSLTYFVDVCKYFTSDYVKMGGHIVSQLSFTAGDHTSGVVGDRAASSGASATVLCTTTTPDLPTFVTALRTAGDKKPIVGPWSIDGGFWEPSNPKISNNIWFSSYASVFGDDPSPQVRALYAEMAAKHETPATGGFVTGPTAIQGIVYAIKHDGGSLVGSKLASVIKSFHNVPTLSGPISFPGAFHSVVGRPYAIVEVRSGKPHFVETLSPGPLAAHF
ncbi:MAG: ABC transporter substrate-binding protein [Acidimicrobiales bacterium]